ncbi:MAG: type VI secretion system lipoprotein TssJ [Burkholderiales bacterium]|nr:type VI secretion system lipoprotein TssJ [Burkholderiales bacterium]
MNQLAGPRDPARAHGPTRRAAALVALSAAFLLHGCAGAPKPVITTVAGAIQASAQLNPSVNQRPSPLALRVYELKSAASFNSADFMALFQNDQATLAADLVGREEMMLQPGENKPYRKTLGADTRFIGVIGAYRNLERANWRVVVPVQPGKNHTLTIRAGDLALSAEAKPQ